MSAISHAQGSALGGFGCLGEQSRPQAGADSPGLVYSQTSDSRPQIPRVDRPPVPGAVRIVPGDARVKRMKKGVITGARLNQQAAVMGGRRPTVAMLTLTYRDDVEWSPLHITGLIKRIRDWASRRDIVISYVWVMELHKSGRPHYHLVAWLPKGYILPKPDKHGWWPWGCTKIERARNAVGYLAKYASKGDCLARFPKGARIHGCGGMLPEHRQERAWWLCPQWVRELWDDWRHRPCPAPGGGWISRLLGEWAPSPWRVILGAGGFRWAYRTDMAAA